MSVGLAPTPTEQAGVDNNNAVKSVKNKNGTVTISVDLDDLTSFASSDPNQGTGKWLALEVKTGVKPITGVTYNGSSLTAQDIADAEATGCSEGSFVLYIKADVVVGTPKTFTLGANGKTKTITINVVEPDGE